MASYRKKPIIVEAQQFLPDRNQWPEDLKPRSKAEPCSTCDQPWAPHGVVFTLEGQMIACPGDWIVNDIKRQKCPVKPDVFNATYEPAEDAMECDLKTVPTHLLLNELQNRGWKD